MQRWLCDDRVQRESRSNDRHGGDKARSLCFDNCWLLARRFSTHARGGANFHVTSPLPWDSFKEEQRGRVARIDSAAGLVSTKRSGESSDYQRTVSMAERMWSNSTDSLEINGMEDVSGNRFVIGTVICFQFWFAAIQMQFSGTPNLCINVRVIA